MNKEDEGTFFNLKDYADHYILEAFDYIPGDEYL
jgi:hypothetical protein